jgi:hypothetical protein
MFTLLYKIRNLAFFYLSLQVPTSTMHFALLLSFFPLAFERNGHQTSFHSLLPPYGHYAHQNPLFKVN